MGLRIKNFDILGVHGGWSSQKTDIEGALPKKVGLGQFADLREGGLGKKEGVGVFEGGGGVDTPMHTMNCKLSETIVFFFPGHSYINTLHYV